MLISDFLNRMEDGVTYTEEQLRKLYYDAFDAALDDMSDRECRALQARRNNYIVAEALATALVALEQAPREMRPSSDMQDMRLLLDRASPRLASHMIAQAKRRLLHPDAYPIDASCAN